MIVKDTSDYLDELQQTYPYLTKKQIHQIIRSSWSLIIDELLLEFDVHIAVKQNLTFKFKKQMYGEKRFVRILQNMRRIKARKKAEKLMKYGKPKEQ